MTRRLRESKFPIKVKDKDLYSFGKVHSLIRKCKPVIKPVYEEWQTLSSENRKRWVLEGATCAALLATGKCDRYHPRPEVQYAKGGLAEKAASAASAALAPVVAAAPKAEDETLSLSSRYAVFLTREQGKPFDVLGDSCAALATGNISDEYLHDVASLLPADRFRLDGIGGNVIIDKVANVYCKVKAIVFDTDQEVRARFESHEYLGADGLYYYFVLAMHPNSEMPKGVLLLPLGKLSRQMGWRVVIDEAKGAASYVLTPEQNGVRLTLKMQVGVEGKDEDDTLLTLPDISLVSKSELANMSFFDAAQAEWARAYAQQQVLMATNADVNSKVALYGAYDRSQEVDLPYSLTASDYKF